MELPNGLAELLAVGGPFGGKTYDPFGLATAARTNPNAAHAQPLASQFKPLALFAQHLAWAKAHLVKGQLKSLIAAIADRFVAFADVKALRADIDQERRDPLARTALCLIDTGGGEDDGKVGHTGARDKVFGPVQDPIRPISPRVRFHPHRIGTCLGFGQGEQFALFAAHGGHQVAVDLVALTGQQQFGGAPDP